MSTQPNPHIGSSFDAFLAEEGILQACEEQAIRQLVAEQVARAMQEQGLTRTAMVARMRTSRAALNRLLDPTNTSVTLQTLQKAAQVIGKRLRLGTRGALPSDEAVDDDHGTPNVPTSYVSSCNSTLASGRSAVSKPSVNQP